MISPCPKRILCPPGTGTESPGVNYSSESVDIPPFPGTVFPPVPGYGYYTACQGRCFSIVSQEDADLCAARLAKICLNEQTTGKTTYGNTPQICTIPSTGKVVIVPAGVFVADSQAEANAQALSYANKQQVNPATPPGVNTVPPPTPNPTPSPTIPNIIPVPTPPAPPEPPTPPPTSHCGECDDSAAVTSFSVSCDIPADTQLMTFESPPLKCGSWRFDVVTNDGGNPFNPQSFITLALAAANPDRTLVDWSTLTDCPQIAYVAPCGLGDECAPQDVQSFGLWPGCCNVTEVDCKYAQCQTLEDGSHWLVVVQINYVCMYDSGMSAKKFTVNGTWLGPLPP